MALVTCSDCLLTYDDTYRLTACPHDGFDMVTTAVRSDGQQKTCTSVAELLDFIEER